MASAIHHLTWPQGHLLVFSSEAQPVSEPGGRGACSDVGLTVLSLGEEGPLPALPREMF